MQAFVIVFYIKLIDAIRNSILYLYYLLFLYIKLYSINRKYKYKIIYITYCKYMCEIKS